jgi:hypothetical protein
MPNAKSLTDAITDGVNISKYVLETKSLKYCQMLKSRNTKHINTYMKKGKYF